MRGTRWGVAVALCVLAWAPHARAQTEEPPPEYFSPGGSWLGRYHLSPYGDARLRFDLVRDRPGATEDLRRVRGRARGGLTWAPRRTAALEAGAVTGLWRAADDAPAASFDNDRGDSIDVDRLAVVIAPLPMVSIAVGKRPLPLATTDLTWDADLRPVGVTLVARRPVGAFDEARVAAVAVRRARPGDADALVAGQIAYALRPGAARGAEAVLGVAGYSGLDELAREGLARQNGVVGSGAGVRFANDFRILEGQVAARTRLGRLPWSVSLHATTNLEADADGRGLRARTTLGELETWPRFEAGYVFQRIEREALPGAFNSDDWWFHTRARGHRVWVASRPARWAVARLSGFSERRDDVARATRRLLIDVELMLPKD